LNKNFFTQALVITICESKPDFSIIGFGASTTGGNNKNIVTVTTVEDLKKHAESAEPATIHINHTLSGGTDGVEIRVKSDKSIIGVGTNAVLEGVGLHLTNVSNIIIRNLKMTMSTVTKTNVDRRNHTVIDVNDGDIITIDGSTNIWIDHNELYNKDPAVNPNKDLYDGLIDIIRKSDNVTLSWNYFHDHYKTNLIGASDTDNFDRRVTFHHNHWRNTNERVPSYRFGHGHVFNNFYEHVVVSGIHTRMGACLVVEKNYFDDVVKPLLSHADSIEDGMFELNDNFFNNIKGEQPTNTSTCSYQLPYKYVLEESSVAKENVMNYAGVGKI
jgi:pectate lyase